MTRFSLVALDMLNNTRDADAKYGDTAGKVSASASNSKLIFKETSGTGGDAITKSLKAKGYDACRRSNSKTEKKTQQQ